MDTMEDMVNRCNIMKQNNLKYKTICFLYAYLRSIDLSLDRSRWGDLEDFKSYFKSKISYINIEEYFLQIANLKSVNSVNYHIKYPNLCIRIKLLLQRQFKIYQLSDNELQYCLQHIRKYLLIVIEVKRCL